MRTIRTVGDLMEALQGVDPRTPVEVDEDYSHPTGQARLHADEVGIEVTGRAVTVMVPRAGR